MPRGDHHSWLDRAVGSCLRLLVGAIAVNVAVKLIEAVWQALLITVAAAAIIALVVAAIRARSHSRGW